MSEGKDGDTVTIRILDDETGEEIRREGIPKSVIERLDRVADYYGISQEEALQMVIKDGLDCIKEVEDLEDDPLFKLKVVRMFGEALHEVLDPSWKPPEGMVIKGNAPPSAIALCIVKMKLHMSEHDN